MVPPLTAEARDYFWLPREADGAVDPRGSYVGSHLEVLIHAVQIHRLTSHQPPHGGRGDPTEGAAALQSLLPGTGKVEQPGRGCADEGRESASILTPSPPPPGHSPLLVCDFWEPRKPRGAATQTSSPFILSPHPLHTQAQRLLLALQLQKLGGGVTAPQTAPVPQPRTRVFLLGPRPSQTLNRPSPTSTHRPPGARPCYFRAGEPRRSSDSTQGWRGGPWVSG